MQALSRTLEGGSGGTLDEPDSEDGPVLLGVDEQAELYCCWAESVVLKFR